MRYVAERDKENHWLKLAQIAPWYEVIGAYTKKSYVQVFIATTPKFLQRIRIQGFVVEILLFLIF